MLQCYNCPMQPLIILHSNDIHGQVDGLARIATLVEDIRAQHPTTPVIYVDAGDSQDLSNPLSKATQGVAMHRLLRVAGCQMSVLGNKCMRRYGMGVVKDYALAAQFPILQANLRLPEGSAIPGTLPSAILPAGNIQLGFIGLTTDQSNFVNEHRLQIESPFSIARAQIDQLKAAGANTVILLSHMGLDMDHVLANQHFDDVALIIGGHWHVLLETGVRVNNVMITQAGSHAEYLGRVDAVWDGNQLRIEQVSVIKVDSTIPQHPRVLAEIQAIESEIR